MGKCLALALLFEAQRLGYARMVLDTPEANAPALALYRSLGFTGTAPYQEPGHDHVHPNWAFLEVALPPPDDVWFGWNRMVLETASLSSDDVYRQSGHGGMRRAGS